jgi:hypothetical protein
MKIVFRFFPSKTVHRLSSLFIPNAQLFRHTPGREQVKSVSQAALLDTSGVDPQPPLLKVI